MSGDSLMTTYDETSADISATFAGLRRRARQLREGREPAAGHWWRRYPGEVLLAVAGIALFVVGGDPTTTTLPWVGAFMVASAIQQARMRRLEARIDELTDLLTRAGYADEA